MDVMVPHYLEKWNNMEIKSYCRITNHSIIVSGKPRPDLENILGEDVVGQCLDKVFQVMKTPYEDFSIMSPFSKLIFVAAELTLNDAKINPCTPKPDMNLTLMSNTATFDEDNAFYKRLDESGYDNDYRNYLFLNPAVICNHLAIRNSIQGELSMFSVDTLKPELIFDYLFSDFSNDTELSSVLLGKAELTKDHASALFFLVTRKDGPVEKDFLYQREVFSDKLLSLY